MTRDVADTARRFEVVPTDTLFDVLETMGRSEKCCLSHAITPLTLGRTLAGPVVTWRMVRDPRRPTEWTPEALTPLSAHFRAITPGSVMLVDGGGACPYGNWGEMLSIMSRHLGARGAVVDGGTRDSRAIRALDDWAVFSRHTSPIESSGRMRIHEVQVPLALDGALAGPVIVHPGDWVVADEDGIIVVPDQIVDEVLVACEALEEVEAAARDALLAGESIDDVFARYGRA